MNPDDFIIARKRKKYRFALFANASNCFELNDWKTTLQVLNLQDVCVEVGSGTGMFSVELAAKNPDQTFIALDVKADRLQKGARAALERGVSNIYFVRARADQLLEVVSQGMVKTIWLTFSDPFPKKRDAKKRLTHPKFLELYKKAHVDKHAQLCIKTDSHALLDWSLEQLVASKWHLTDLSYDLHESNLSSDYKIMTTYEQKWTSQGLPIMLVVASSDG